MIFGSRKKPKGPNWKKSETFQRMLSDHRLAFEAPRQEKVRGFAKFNSSQLEIDLEDSDYEPIVDVEGRHFDGHVLKPVFSGAWNFYGNPLIEKRELGHVVCFMSVVKILDMPINGSLFTHRELLLAADRILKEGELGHAHGGYAEEESPFDLTEYKWPDFLAPINQQWINNNGVAWLYFEAQPLYNHMDQIWWLTPIDHDKYLAVTFTVHRYCSGSGNPFRREFATPLQPYKNFCEKIMQTVDLVLSDDIPLVKEAALTTDSDYPFIEFPTKAVPAAIHTLYMWSGRGYYGENMISENDHRVPREQVTEFVQSRIQPRPLPGCVAIASAPSIQELQSLDTNWTGAIEHAV